MKPLDPIIEERLDQASARWKWVKFLQYAATLGIAVTLLVLFLGAGAALGWFTQKGLLQMCLVLIAAGAVFVFVIMGLAVAASRLEEGRLAGAIERVCPALLDRLNTLVFLQDRRSQPRVNSYYRRIENQALTTLLGRSVPSPFSSRRALGRLGILVALIVATAWFYSRFTPFERIVMASVPEEQVTLELPPEQAEVVPEVPAWGEVRITRPGRDITVTRVETVQLQIEAAASRPVKSVEWITSINGGEESPHKLPPPLDPHYAVYQPAINLEEWDLGEWDVISYYAKATVEGGDSYYSDVYFIEIWPFREELEKMPGSGGGAGTPYSAMDMLTEMIERQKQVIQETHRQLHSPDAQEEPQETRRKTHNSLADTEKDLGEITRHFAAGAQAAFEPQALESPASHLGQASEALDQAESAFRESDLGQAQPPARQALGELVAARQSLQEQMSANPGAFTPPMGGAPDLSEILRRLSDLRNQARMASEQVRELAKKQGGIAERSRTTNRVSYPQMAGEEEGLRQELQDIQREHAGAFRAVPDETTAADQEMQMTADRLRRRNSQAPQRATNATKRLEELAEALDNQAHMLQLAMAYAAAAMIDQSIAQMGEIEQQPGAMSGQELTELAEEAKMATGVLKQVAEEDPTRQDFGQPLRDALSDEKKQQLDAQANGLAGAQGSGARMQAAGAARAGLQQVSDAFSESQPPMLAQMMQGRGLQPGGQQALARGLRGLQGLMPGNQEGGKALSTLARMKLWQEALANLEDGIEDDAELQRLLRQLRRRGDPRTEVDVEMVRKLIEQLQNRAVEVAERRKNDEDGPDAEYIDPAAWPPAYRDRIREYYRLLSEQR